jgi:hypothetical protein
MLSISDISRETPWYDVEESSVSGVPLLLNGGFYK